jgi:hypothetical protein
MARVPFREGREGLSRIVVEVLGTRSAQAYG